MVQFCSAASISKEESDTGQAEFLILTELCKGKYRLPLLHTGIFVSVGTSSSVCLVMSGSGVTHSSNIVLLIWVTLHFFRNSEGNGDESLLFLWLFHFLFCFLYFRYKCPSFHSAVFYNFISLHLPL